VRKPFITFHGFAPMRSSLLMKASLCDGKRGARIRASKRV
jgi:hypothetical protein